MKTTTIACDVCKKLSCLEKVRKKYFYIGWNSNGEAMAEIKVHEVPFTTKVRIINDNIDDICFGCYETLIGSIFSKKIVADMMHSARLEQLPGTVPTRILL